MKPFRAVVAIAILANAMLGASVNVTSTTLVQMPAPVDSNSPGFWLNSLFHLVNSTANGKMLSAGTNQSHLDAPGALTMNPVYARPTWMESVWNDPSGAILGWYHQEMAPCGGTNYLAQPQIGAAVSHDGGSTFLDLGLVITSGDPPDCGALNGYTAGGNGDFSVILDQAGKYFYFLYTNYGGPLASQGVAVARMAYANRLSPAGMVWKYYNGGWTQPGMSGTETPVFPAKVEWQKANTNSFWGPSIHWNTYLASNVVLLNHSCCTPGYPQEGIYVSFSTNLANPYSWSTPEKIMNSSNWYPQVLGNGAAGTDRVAGQNARLYIRGQSSWQISFVK